LAAIRRASSFVSKLGTDRQPWRAVPPTRPANSILSLFLRANYALRWVKVTQAKKMCDGTRKPDKFSATNNTRPESSVVKTISE